MGRLYSNKKEAALFLASYMFFAQWPRCRDTPRAAQCSGGGIARPPPNVRPSKRLDRRLHARRRYIPGAMRAVWNLFDPEAGRRQNPNGYKLRLFTFLVDKLNPIFLNTAPDWPREMVVEVRNSDIPKKSPPVQPPPLRARIRRSHVDAPNRPNSERPATIVLSEYS